MANVAVTKLTEKDLGSLFAEIGQYFENVRKRAYELFERRGGAEGGDLADWLKAENELFWKPASELAETGEEYEMRVTVPGLEAKDIEITALPDQIIVKGAAAQNREHVKGELRFSEFSDRELFRQFGFSSPVDVNKINATLDKGILKIVAAKGLKTEEKSKKIAVAASQAWTRSTARTEPRTGYSAGSSIPRGIGHGGDTP